MLAMRLFDGIKLFVVGRWGGVQFWEDERFMFDFDVIWLGLGLALKMIISRIKILASRLLFFYGLGVGLCVRYIVERVHN